MRLLKLYTVWTGIKVWNTFITWKISKPSNFPYLFWFDSRTKDTASSTCRRDGKYYPVSISRKWLISIIHSQYAKTTTFFLLQLNCGQECSSGSYSPFLPSHLKYFDPHFFSVKTYRQHWQSLSNWNLCEERVRTVSTLRREGMAIIVHKRSDPCQRFERKIKINSKAFVMKRVQTSKIYDTNVINSFSFYILFLHNNTRPSPMCEQQEP